MDLNLGGKVALVTGGCSGSGRAIACALLEAGCEVHIADLDPNAGCDCPEFDSGNAQQLRLDVTDAAAVHDAVDAIVAQGGRLDILVNCAAILATKSLVESSVADWDDVCRVNLSGVYYCSKAVLPTMTAQRYGKIVNLAAVAAAKGGAQPGNVLYGATKAGVVALTQGFARELGPFGINVNAISPGLVDTATAANLMPADARARIVAALPLRRLVRTADIARTALFLASDLSAGITGQVIAVDAGYLVA
jgi:3-oxoacyl-[acyl-carrier protein] reductase